MKMLKQSHICSQENCKGLHLTRRLFFLSCSSEDATFWFLNPKWHKFHHMMDLFRVYWKKWFHCDLNWTWDSETTSSCQERSVSATQLTGEWQRCETNLLKQWLVEWNSQAAVMPKWNVLCMIRFPESSTLIFTARRKNASWAFSHTYAGFRHLIRIANHHFQQCVEEDN